MSDFLAGKAHFSISNDPCGPKNWYLLQGKDLMEDK